MYFVKKFIIGYFVKIWHFIFGRDPQKLPDDSISDTIPDNLEAEGIHISRGVWDKFIDGLNRLPRPIGTFGVYGLIATAIFASDKYAEIMISLSKTPYMMFVIYLTIIGFWFGGKIISQFGDKKLLQSMDPDKVLKRIDEANQRVAKVEKKIKEQEKKVEKTTPKKESTDDPIPEIPEIE